MSTILRAANVDRRMIPLLRPLLPSAERLLPYLKRIDAGRIYTNHGPLVREFEQRLRCLIGHDLRLATATSGTLALEAAIVSAAPLSPERPLALMPSFTFTATALAAERCGYKPYFLDIDPDTWMIDPAKLGMHPMIDKAGLVIPVAPLGRPVPAAAWAAFSQATGIPVVIDAAGSLSQIFDDPEQFVGSVPVIASLHATKGFSSGEGGLVLSRDESVIHGCVRALNFGFYGSRESLSAGTNGKMSEYHAAIGLAELDGWKEKRQRFLAVADIYQRVAADRGLADRFFCVPEVGISYAILEARSVDESLRIRQHLEAASIGSRLWYENGLHLHAHFARTPRDAMGASEKTAARLIGLPMAPDLVPDQIVRILATVADAVFGPARAVQGL
ncbi:DegT/DnrJ/EryC1/StrS family aminotransferase [Ancylobacter amanitiformis]|uniref:dTDP-4-amino-4,6-dideoxygalactose transaminase n=1 Tax=Ancylobacter amanitiformis TaxID=217069 RepID=A0ABU0LTW8_9HYPH|nr:DegT/DnrJ/EryC1/StrS family aminotransferase [Ancylobacter amanitiformis]MDQ0512167.1 dTDP-4-amino-4,6-dideoxygalactose transaminase [Ancylobacter amanitiformis]